MEDFERVEITVNLKLREKNDTVFKQSLVNDGQECGGKQKSIALLVLDFETS